MSNRPASSHDTADWFEQKGFGLRFGWGPNGLRRLAPQASVVVIVDVLSFSTSVDVALGRGAVVLPYRWHDGTEVEYAESNHALVAARNPAPGQLSLRPSSLRNIDAGTRLVLPSPNGSALAFAAVDAGAAEVVVGSLRNASVVGRAVVARAAAGHVAVDLTEPKGGGGLGGAERVPGGVIAVIAAGERWRGSTGPLRPAIEDLFGAGAILSAAAAAGAGPASPEARVAMASFQDAKPDLSQLLSGCGSGLELIGRGFRPDVELAAELDVSTVVPTLRGAELVNVST